MSVNMEKQRMIDISYTILGVIFGKVFLNLNNFFLIVSILIFTYFIPVFFIYRKEITKNPKERVKLIAPDTFITYVLVWLVTFILLSNVLA